MKQERRFKCTLFSKLAAWFCALGEKAWVQSLKRSAPVQFVLKHKAFSVTLLAVFLAVTVLLVCFVCGVFRRPPAPPLPEPPPVTVPQDEPQNTEPSPDPVVPEPQILPELQELYAQNPDLCGWLKVEGTKLDYPVMFTPDEPEKYLRKDFEGNYHISGLPFLEDVCSLDPESDNLILYGHNMKDGTAFRTAWQYSKESFYKEHPVIEFYTLYEKREYEVLAAFYDRVYYAYEDVFKFYKFVDAADEADYDRAIEYYKTHALYDTGVSAEYGDKLITLVTCADHVPNGRFVVIAREKTAE